MTTHDTISPTNEQVNTKKQEQHADRNLAARKTVNLIWIFTSAVESLLGFRLLLKMLSANPNSPFAQWVYQASSIFSKPFTGLVANIQIGSGILEISTLIAMLVYIVLTWLLIEFIVVIFRW